MAEGIRFEFNVGKKPTQVEVDDNVLKWQVEGSGESSVAIDDLLRVEEKPGELTVHYIHREDTTWTARRLDLQGKEEETRRVAEILKEKLQQIGEGRPKNLLVLVNPGCGSKKGKQIYEDVVAPLFDLAGVATEVIITKDSGHLQEAVDTHDLNGKDGITVVGGDGSLHLAINAYFRRMAREAEQNLDDPSIDLTPAQLPIGHIPGGTIQQMCEMVIGSKDVATATLHIIKGGRRHLQLDSVHAGGRLLCLSSQALGFGMAADYIKNINNRSLGALRLILGVIKLIWQFGCIHAKVSYRDDNGEWHEYEKRVRFLIAVHFKPQDGKLAWRHDRFFLSTFDGDTVRSQYIQHASKYMKLASDAYDAEPHKSVWTKECRLTIQPRPEEMVNCDGELYPVTEEPLHIRVHPNVLTMFSSIPSHVTEETT